MSFFISAPLKIYTITKPTKRIRWADVQKPYYHKRLGLFGRTLFTDRRGCVTNLCAKNVLSGTYGRLHLLYVPSAKRFDFRTPQSMNPLISASLKPFFHSSQKVGATRTNISQKGGVSQIKAYFGLSEFKKTYSSFLCK